MDESNNTSAAAAAEQEPTQGQAEKTFTQAEVNELISREKARAVAKATKGVPTSEEIGEYRAWKQTQEAERTAVDTLQRERDGYRDKLAAAEAELEQLRREKYVLSKGFKGEEAEFVVFKAAKSVSKDVSFEQAVDSMTPENGNVTFDWTAPLGSGTVNNDSTNAKMNALIRGARKG